MAKLLGGTRIYGTGTIDTQLIVSGSTATASTNTGALIVAGGAGFGGGIYVGGIITTTNLTITGRDIALGNSANATGDSVAIGFASSAIAGTGVSVGRQASSAGGIGIGYAAQSVGSGVALGAFAGLNGATNGIVINATGSQLNGPAGGLVIAPIRGDATTSATTFSLYYNPVTKEITTATIGLATTATFARNIVGGTVGSILVQTSTNSTGFVTPVNTSGYVLQSVASSTPRWVDLTPQVLNDISNQFDGRKVVFDLRVDQTSINTTVDSKDVEVVINGLRLTPYVDTFTYPWITPYDSFRGFRVAAGKLILYNAPYRGDSSYVMLRPGTTARQKRRYPFAATTVALGD